MLGRHCKSFARGDESGLAGGQGLGMEIKAWERGSVETVYRAPQMMGQKRRGQKWLQALSPCDWKNGGVAQSGHQETELGVRGRICGKRRKVSCGNFESSGAGGFDPPCNPPESQPHLLPLSHTPHCPPLSSLSIWSSPLLSTT